MGGSWRNPIPAAPVIQRKPLQPKLTVQGSPHEMSYLTRPTIQDARTRPQESANRNSVFPQAIGRSPYLQSVYVEDAAHLIGRIVPVRITAVGNNSLQGALVEKVLA